MTADGIGGGHGRLVATILCDLSLTEPLDLGSAGSFVSPRSGRLYLRCDDQWHELSDNKGVIRVSLRRKSASAVDERPAADPAQANVDTVY